VRGPIEDVRRFFVDIAKAPVAILHDEGIGDAGEDAAAEGIGLLGLDRPLGQLRARLLELLLERL